MDHIAIDLGGRESQICVRQEDGRILEEARVPTLRLGKYLAGRPRSRVVMETCAEAFALAQTARSLGHEPQVVPASLVRSLGVGARGLKNDERDARNLSSASCRMESLPSVHIPSAASRERKGGCALREGLVGSRTKLINGVRGWLRSQGYGRPRQGDASTFAKRVRELWMRLKEGQEPLPAYVTRHLTVIEELTKQIAAADKELEGWADADERCTRLMTVPGVGPVTAVRFVAAVDEVERFADAHSLQSYLGLTPGENSSSERRRTTGITKAGAKQVRWALVQAAWVARRTRPHDPMVLWSLEVQRRRGKPVAITALARKLAGVLYALWRDKTTYCPARGANELTIREPTNRQPTTS
jgi:transposase